MAEACDRWRTLHLQLNELTMHDLPIDNDRLKVAQLVLKLSLLVLATEVVDALLELIAL